jgi:hypothetical protein
MRTILIIPSDMAASAVRLGAVVVVEINDDTSAEVTTNYPTWKYGGDFRSYEIAARDRMIERRATR